MVFDPSGPKSGPNPKTQPDQDDPKNADEKKPPAKAEGLILKDWLLRRDSNSRQGG